MNSSIKILGVDDRPANLMALEAVLEPLAITFVQANSGQKALEMILEQDFALILMDVQMPDMDGFETAVHIRSNKRASNIPIIFVTAISFEKKHVFKGYESGAVDYLLKPIESDILVSKVKVFIELHQQRKNAENRAKELEKANICILEQQQVLEENETRFRAAFDQSFQFMAILDTQGRVVELNSLARENFCAHSLDIKGKPLWDMLSLAGEKERKQLQDKIEKAAETDASNDEILFITADGEKATVLCDISPVMDDTGQVIYITMQGQDITQRKKAEKEKLQIEAQLRQAQKMEALGTLAGGIAHDFNNMLSVIVGYADMGRTRAQAGSFEEKSLSKITIAAEKAKQLVQQILGFSRQSEFEQIPCNPLQVMEESLKLIKVSIPSSIELKTNINPACGQILADPTQLSQIMINLCTNANHAMEYMGGVLEITFNEIRVTESEQWKETGLSLGRYAHISISDDGQGMDEETIERIFDPYFTTKEVGKGTGMGLSIVHGIVKKHRGHIRVKSRLGKGTVFDIYFPIIDEKEKIDQTEKPKSVASGYERILVVDDEREFLEMSKEMIESMGYHVTIEQNSLQALEKFQQNPDQFDLVMTDYTMPDMNGIEMARRFHEIRPGFPVILCTGYAGDLTQEKASDLGIKDLIYKPMDFDRLSKTIQKNL